MILILKIHICNSNLSIQPLRMMRSSLDRYLYGFIYDSDICLFTNLNSATNFKGRVFIFILLQEIRTLNKICENMAFYWPVVSHTRTESWILLTHCLPYKDRILNFTDPCFHIQEQNFEFYAVGTLCNLWCR